MQMPDDDHDNHDHDDHERTRHNGVEEDDDHEEQCSQQTNIVCASRDACFS